MIKRNTSSKTSRTTSTPVPANSMRIVACYINAAICSTACLVQVKQPCAWRLLACSIWISTWSVFALMVWIKIASPYYFNLFLNTVSLCLKTWTRLGSQSARPPTAYNSHARMQRIMNKIVRWRRTITGKPLIGSLFLAYLTLLMVLPPMKATFWSWPPTPLRSWTTLFSTWVALIFRLNLAMQALYLSKNTFS